MSLHEEAIKWVVKKTPKSVENHSKGLKGVVLKNHLGKNVIPDVVTGGKIYHEVQVMGVKRCFVPNMGLWVVVPLYEQFQHITLLGQTLDRKHFKVLGRFELKGKPFEHADHYEVHIVKKEEKERLEKEMKKARMKIRRLREATQNLLSNRKPIEAKIRKLLKEKRGYEEMLARLKDAFSKLTTGGTVLLKRREGKSIQSIRVPVEESAFWLNKGFKLEEGWAKET